MWIGLLALLLRAPLLETPEPVAASVRYDGDRVWIELEGGIQDPVRVFAPEAKEVWINNEKMTCRMYGRFRLATLPILHNQEPCEPY